jgi:hypothetical protein
MFADGLAALQKQNHGALHCDKGILSKIWIYFLTVLGAVPTSSAMDLYEIEEPTFERNSSRTGWIAPRSWIFRSPGCPSGSSRRHIARASDPHPYLPRPKRVPSSSQSALKPNSGFNNTKHFWRAIYLEGNL